MLTFELSRESVVDLFIYEYLLIARVARETPVHVVELGADFPALFANSPSPGDALQP